MTDTSVAPIEQEWWEITVGGGYGTFPFFGTEDEAEEMRAHKARWEAAIARKWRVAAPEGGEREGRDDAD